MATILVIDDHPDNRGVMAAVLAPFGHRVIEAGDGADGLALAHAEHPDLVIADILMPTMDGYEFVRRLRAEPPIATTPVVFYTAYFHSREAHALARQCGVEHIITKPCEPEAVLRIVEAMLAGGATAASSPPKADRAFDASHVRLVSDRLSRTADDLGIANQRLMAMHEGNLKLASEREPRLILQGLCDTARQLVGAQHSLVVAGFNGHSNGRREPCLIANGMDETAIAELDGVRLDSIFAGMAQGGSGVVHRRAANGAASLAGLPPGFPPVRTLLLTTLRSLHHVYGWVCLINKVGGADFAADDAQVLETLARLAGRIYENGSLYAELNQRAAELEREIVVRSEAEARVVRLHRIQTLLSSINGLIVRVRDRQELFDEACQIAVRHGGFSSAWIGVVDSTSDAVRWVAAVGGDTPGAAPWRMTDAAAEVDSRRDLIARAMASHEAAYDDDTATGRRLKGPGSYRSAIALPLLLDGAVVGVYVLFAVEYGVFNEEELRILNELAGDISFALDYMAQADRAEHLAYYDPVTGLPNRRLFFEHLAHALHREPSKHSVAVAIGDIKHFRAVNESLGLGAGDAVLKEIARRLQNWVENPENLARIVGDRFATFLTGIRDATDIAHRIERLVADSLRTPITVDDTQLRLGFAIGVAIHPQDGADAETLFHNAEAALARAKSTGESYAFYEPSLNARIADKLQLESRLRRALEDSEFVLHYQPKIATRSGHITGVEALIRWQDPERGLIPPGQFIPVLEETGMIIDVGNWALTRAADDHKAWQAAGLAAPRVAVNISPLQLRHRDFINNVMQALEHFDGDVALDLEITEGMLIDHFQDATKRLHVVRGLGVEIALDDFGTGYSSLGYIARLPINTIKIDRSFVVGMLDDPYCLNIVTLITNLAHTLGLEVVAEGVEEIDQAEALRELECDALQGYLFSRPLPAGSLADFLRLPPSPPRIP